MLDVTQRKLREARFFSNHLIGESQKVVRNEPEAFLFYLSAFLSAAQSARSILKEREGGKDYDNWEAQWSANRIQDERDLLDFMWNQRNRESHRRGAQTTPDVMYVPVTAISTDRGHPAYGFHWFGLPDTPPPSVGIPTRTFTLGGTQEDVVAVCKRYLDVLDTLIQDFMSAHA